MALWPTPLKKGQKVQTGDGFHVLILEKPLSTSPQTYDVPVLILGARSRFHELIGRRTIWGHIAPHTFVNSAIKRINGQKFRSDLEREFFSRKP